MLYRFITRFALAAAIVAGSISAVSAQTMTLLQTSSTNVNNLVNLGTASTPGYVSGSNFTANFTGFTANVGFTGASGVVQGATAAWNVAGINGSSWAPTIGSTPVTQNYLVAARGTIMLTLSASINNFQFLWGSPGAGDIVTLYSGGTQVAQFTGAQVNAANAAFGNLQGTSVITDLQTSGGVTFDRVAISNPTSNFEFALQTSQATPPTSAPGNVVVGSLPSPAPSPLLGATLLGNLLAFFGMFSLWKRKFKRRQLSGKIIPWMA